MPKPYPKEFRDDVVAVARQGGAPLKQMAKDFRISEGCLSNWLEAADVEDGHPPGVTVKEAAELREARKRIRLSTLPAPGATAWISLPENRITTRWAAPAAAGRPRPTWPPTSTAGSSPFDSPPARPATHPR